MHENTSTRRGHAMPPPRCAPRGLRGHVAFAPWPKPTTALFLLPCRKDSVVTFAGDVLLRFPPVMAPLAENTRSTEPDVAGDVSVRTAKCRMVGSWSAARFEFQNRSGSSQ